MRIIISLFLLSQISLFAQEGAVWWGTSMTNIIPILRMTDWTPYSRVGPRGGPITNRTVFTNVVNIDNTGATDVLTDLQAIINSCPSNQSVVLPAGTYSLNGILYLADWTTLKGVGTNTILRITNGYINKSYDHSLHTFDSEQTVTSGLERGSSNIVVPNSAAFTQGGLVFISQAVTTNQFDNPIIIGVGGTNGINTWLHYHVAVCDATNANSVTFWPPLPGYMTNRFAKAKPGLFSLSRGKIGVEDMFLDMQTNCQLGIFLGGVQDCWIHRVKIRTPSNYLISLADCVGMEVQSCDIRDLRLGGSNGAGLLCNRVNCSLIENNVIANAFPDMEINSGSCGNVFAYNFCHNTNGSLGMDSNHGPHNRYNLYEGNISISHISDAYFGSESDGTIFRGWDHGIDQSPDHAIGYTFALKRFTRNYSIVGCVSGAGLPYTMSYEGYSYGQPNMGNSDSTGVGPPWIDWLKATNNAGYQELDTNVAATVIQVHNWNFFTNAIPTNESIGSTNILASLYRSASPPWYVTNGNLPQLVWPPIVTASLNTNHFLSLTGYYKTPAHYAYVNNAWPTNGEAAPLVHNVPARPGFGNFNNFRK